MQPYFFPYIGYFQLMNAVDEFVVYDNIEFSKKGWINRNRILVNGQDVFITLSLRKDSDYLNINERYLAQVWPVESIKMLNRIIAAYRKAPYFESVFPIIEKSLLQKEDNLFSFLLFTLKELKAHLSIKTPLVISSSIKIDHKLRSEDKVLEICKERLGTEYINPIGGLSLYEKARFSANGILLRFLRADEIIYPQFNNSFVPWLSIIDVMMFSSIDEMKVMLQRKFTLE